MRLLLLCERGAAELSREVESSKLAFKSTSLNFALPKKLLELYPSYRPPKTTAHTYLRRVAEQPRGAVCFSQAVEDAKTQTQTAIR